MKNWMIILCAIALSGCASSGAVIPGPDGVFMVSSDGWNDDSAVKPGLESAQAECAKTGRRHIVLKINNNYDNRGGTLTAFKKQIVFRCE
jgi:hypothetical protein